jgi:hypothetical protein
MHLQFSIGDAGVSCAGTIGETPISLIGFPVMGLASTEDAK